MPRAGTERPYFPRADPLARPLDGETLDPPPLVMLPWPCLPAGEMNLLLPPDAGLGAGFFGLMLFLAMMHSWS